MSAGSVETVAEVGEQRLAPAGATLRELPHHVDPGPLYRLVALHFGQGQPGGLDRHRAGLRAAQPPVRFGHDNIDLGEQAEQLGQLAGREATAFAQLGAVVRALAQYRDEVANLRLSRGAAGEVPLQSHVLATVQEHRPGGCTVATGPADLLQVAVG